MCSKVQWRKVLLLRIQTPLDKGLGHVSRKATKPGDVTAKGEECLEWTVGEGEDRYQLRLSDES